MRWSLNETRGHVHKRCTSLAAICWAPQEVRLCAACASGVIAVSRFPLVGAAGSAPRLAPRMRSSVPSNAPPRAPAAPQQTMATDSKSEPIVSGKSYDATVLAPEDAWIANLDHEAFKEDIRALGKELHSNQGPADLAHLNKIILWQRMCMVVGFGEQRCAPAHACALRRARVATARRRIARHSTRITHARPRARSDHV
eukprot:1788739-Prymnesium_polylepis.1